MSNVSRPLAVDPGETTVIRLTQSPAPVGPYRALAEAGPGREAEGYAPTAAAALGQCLLNVELRYPKGAPFAVRLENETPPFWGGADRERPRWVAAYHPGGDRVPPPGDYWYRPAADASRLLVRVTADPGDEPRVEFSPGTVGTRLANLPPAAELVPCRLHPAALAVARKHPGMWEAVTFLYGREEVSPAEIMAYLSARHRALAAQVLGTLAAGYGPVPAADLTLDVAVAVAAARRAQEGGDPRGVRAALVEVADTLDEAHPDETPVGRRIDLIAALRAGAADVLALLESPAELAAAEPAIVEAAQ